MVLASVAVVVAVAVLGAVGISLSRSLKELRRLLGEIRRDLVPAVERIEEASGRVTGEVQRVGGLLDVAEAVSERAESLSRVTYRALVEPFAAVASLFRREGATGPDVPAAGEPVAGGGARDTTAAPGSARQGSWMRRAALYLLRSGYRSASARVAARLAAAQAQRSTAAATRTGGGATPRSPEGAADGAGDRSRAASPAAAGGDVRGRSWGRELLAAVREVTDEISAAMEEGRQTLRAERRGEGRPE